MVVTLLWHGFLSFTYVIICVVKNDVVKNTKTSVSILELRILLVELNEKRNDICIRFRFIGEMWQTNFFKIIDYTESGLVINDPASNKLMFVKNLSMIMQFEIDMPFQSFEPHFHYNVVPDRVAQHELF